MQQTYYDRLGLSPDATLDEIRSAYRRLSLQYHPDANQGSPERFLHLKEAYETLSDPDRREDYDRELDAQQRKQIRQPAGPSESIFASSVHRGRSPLEDVAEVFSKVPIAPTASRITPNMAEDPPIDILLTPQEAAMGGYLVLRCLLPAVCSYCQGTGKTGHWTCPLCHGEGLIDEEHRVAAWIPRQVRDGTLIPLPLAASRRRRMLRVQILG
ncbi:MAG TPA: DnaJ domain-containing protein [Tepidisphaeraceae bacterium]|nr:DnaJ domain-containing protein [Tepidisphaeraceae bacterium]